MFLGTLLVVGIAAIVYLFATRNRTIAQVSLEDCQIVGSERVGSAGSWNEEAFGIQAASGYPEWKQ